jgi:putative acetyltransferase
VRTAAHDCQRGGEADNIRLRGLTIAETEVSVEDVDALVRTHRNWSHEQTPREFSHAMSTDQLREGGITVFAARADNGRLLGIAALKELEPTHGEIKSMHTTTAEREQGVARALLDHVLSVACSRGYRRLSLETGTSVAFAPARALYQSVGFRPGQPFGEYANTEHNLCMTLELPSPHP